MEFEHKYQQGGALAISGMRVRHGIRPVSCVDAYLSGNVPTDSAEKASGKVDVR